MLFAVSHSFATPWTVAHQVPLCMGFLRQEYWSGLPFPFPGYLLDPGIKPSSPALVGGFFTAEPLEKSSKKYKVLKVMWVILPSVKCLPLT